MGLSDRHYMDDSSSGRSYFSEKNILFTLIAINVGIFILSTITQNSRFWLYNIALSSYGIQHFKIWQFVTYMFLHGGVMHILFNMYGLYLFGSTILPVLGTSRFLKLYFISGVSGAALWLLFNWTSRAPVIGASGAVFGVMMAAAMLYPTMRIQLLFPPIPMTLKTFVLVFGGIEILMEISSRNSIAHLAHLGGFISAYFYIKSVYGNKVWDFFDPVRQFFQKHQPPKKKKPEPKTKVPEGWSVYSNPNFYQAPVSKEEVDRILDKISERGMHSLTEDELATLKRASGEIKH